MQNTAKTNGTAFTEEEIKRMQEQIEDEKKKEEERATECWDKIQAILEEYDLELTTFAGRQHIAEITKQMILDPTIPGAMLDIKIGKKQAVKA